MSDVSTDETFEAIYPIDDWMVNLSGVENEENPLEFFSLEDNSYFHFIRNDEPSVGHLDGLLSTDDSLFIADLSPGGDFSGRAGSSGVIYQIQIPEPSSFWLAFAVGVLQSEIVLRYRMTLLCSFLVPHHSLRKRRKKEYLAQRAA